MMVIMILYLMATKSLAPPKKSSVANMELQSEDLYDVNSTSSFEALDFNCSCSTLPPLFNSTDFQSLPLPSSLTVFLMFFILVLLSSITIALQITLSSILRKMDPWRMAYNNPRIR